MPPAPRDLVYILRSDIDHARHYVGLTSDVERRLQFHNESLTGHTARLRPWSVVATVWFHDPRLASQFEKYLKSGSGRAFAKTHFNIDPAQALTAGDLTEPPT